MRRLNNLPKGKPDGHKKKEASPARREDPGQTAAQAATPEVAMVGRIGLSALRRSLRALVCSLPFNGRSPEFERSAHDLGYDPG